MISWGKASFERRRRVRKLGAILIMLAGGFSTCGFLFFPKHQQEAFYMVSLMFLVMAVFCFFGRPK